MNEAPLVHLDADLDPTGRGPVLINGRNVSDEIAAISVQAGGPQQTSIVVELQPGYAQLAIDGELTVRASEPAEGVVGFLDSIDPEEFEQLMLARARLSTSMAADALDVLKEIARARHTGAARPQP